MPSVYMNLKNFQKGKIITVPSLGGFENGTTSEVSQRKFDAFVLRPGVKVVDDTIYITSGNDDVAPDNSEPDPELEVEVQDDYTETEDEEEDS